MVEDMLNDLIEADETTTRYAPYLEKGEIEFNRFGVKDSKLNRIVDVYLREKIGYCGRSARENRKARHSRALTAFRGSEKKASQWR